MFVDGRLCRSKDGDARPRAATLHTLLFSSRRSSSSATFRRCPDFHGNRSPGQILPWHVQRTWSLTLVKLAKSGRKARFGAGRIPASSPILGERGGPSENHILWFGAHFGPEPEILDFHENPGPKSDSDFGSWVITHEISISVGNRDIWPDSGQMGGR